MAGEDLDEGADGGAPAATGPDGKKKKPLSKGQKIGVVIGVVTILLVIVQIERSKAAASSSTTAASTPIDPQTGDPVGSAADQAALAQLDSAYGGGLGGSSGYYTSPTPDTSTVSGTDPSTGLSYSAEISSNANGISTLQQEIQTDFSTLTTEITGISTVQPQSPTPPPTPPPTTPTGPTAQQSANLAKLNQELGKDQAAKSPNKTAIATLKKQIAAVTARS